MGLCNTSRAVASKKLAMGEVQIFAPPPKNDAKTKTFPDNIILFPRDFKLKFWDESISKSINSGNS